MDLIALGLLIPLLPLFLLPLLLVVAVWIDRRRAAHRPPGRRHARVGRVP